ncbi:MAG: tannase/feruloyl esterase family alpha/beta hydrolase [Alphaproteobacteria bacterium]|nr:tannase/feruloyl esterase family alpha/beta hydrolase [Alphaproteobacteria bacterium]MBU0792575.1 tannase/feruloyl esterase family alpha/beta hydrolase [Alphaproteobacteria bacterium]MBU0874784.1 tannase/feruloyl esterase family alpha/beta hydrolase [Alphaproteobacteria bacterium]MBU1768642.1 tannase/feruloyl esterase family alpha/beta hydrolase [Alphaproteobacteria bacterium]
MFEDKDIRSCTFLSSRRALLSAGCATALLALGAVSAAAQDRPPVSEAFVKGCGDLSSFKGDDATDRSVRITEAALVAAGEIKDRSPRGEMTLPVPAHCAVKGLLQEREGANGQRYAVKFHLRLPANWNGRFIFQGGGGSNGNLGNAVAPLNFAQSGELSTGLGRGYAVVSQDSGHDNDVNIDASLQGDVTFGHDFQARRDYAHTSHEVVTRVAKALINAMYGRAPQYSYYVGCSKGGQEGMMMAQRYPSYFDGILSTAPGFTLPKAAAVTQVWDTQVLGRVARSLNQFDRKGVPLINKAFSDKDLALVSDAILRSCDKLDGLSDGLVQNFRQCTSERLKPALSALTCTNGKTDSCLTQAQVTGLIEIHEGPKNAEGMALYSDWPWDAGIGGKMAGGGYYQGWRSWKMGPYASDVNNGVNVVLGGAASSAVFITPPERVPMDESALTQWMLNFDLQKNAWRIFHSNADYPESPWDLMSADSLDRAQFRDNGGKLLLVHGIADPIFSINDTVRWLEALDRVEDGQASQYARLFAVPGMAHCAGGPATSDYDAFGALVDWVEKDTAPERIIARGGPDTPWGDRTRPLCPYPKIARYDGEGDPEDAASFVCG